MLHIITLLISLKDYSPLRVKHTVEGLFPLASKLLRIYWIKLKTVIYHPKFDEFYRIIHRYRAIPFTISENDTEKPVDTVNANGIER